MPSKVQKGIIAMLELTNTEQVIMKCIWEIGDNVAVADLLERLKTEYGKEYARTTISVFMSYLRDKGYVTYEKRSHAYVYKPLISEEEYQKDLMKRYQKNSFNGSAVDFIRTYLDSQELTAEELDEIRVLVEEKQKKM